MMRKRFRRIMRSKKTTMVLAGAAIVLLLASGIGSARAALTYFSENYTDEDLEE